MASGKYLRVILTAFDQFGPEGPQPGAEGIVIGTSYDEFEKWYQVLFKGFPGYFNVNEDMIAIEGDDGNFS